MQKVVTPPISFSADDAARRQVGYRSRRSLVHASRNAVVEQPQVTITEESASRKKVRRARFSLCQLLKVLPRRASQ